LRGGAGVQAARRMPGRETPPRERENPDLLISPQTDAGTIPNLKFSFAAARNRLTTGGWSGRSAPPSAPSR
jgi:hypothetical protein